ncbi:MAG: Gfo/Idh/MocA family protein [Anaerolineae bacterium]
MGLTLCVVGCGQHAKTIAKAIRSSDLWGREDGVELFFASRDREKASAYCRMFNATDFFASYEEAASDQRVQALYVCTPNHLHLEHTLLATRFRKHVLVEKPMARTLEEAEHMIAAARDAGVQLMVAENYRYIPVVQKCSELITEGTIGALRLIQIQEETDFAFDGWRNNSEIMGGGVFIDGGIHTVDVLINLGGMPKEVYAVKLPQALQGLEGEDGIVMMAQLKGGATGLINYSWGISKRDWKLWVAISGSRGRIYFEPSTSTLTVETGEGRTTSKYPEDRWGFVRMVRDFKDSVEKNRPSLTSGQEGLRDLQVVLKAYDSAERGVPLALE